MKAILSKETYTIKLDAEAIKAIRFVRGFTTDLRITLKHANKESLWHWLDDNRLDLFGTDMMNIRPTATDENWDKYETMLNDVVRQIVDGRGRI